MSASAPGPGHTSRPVRTGLRVPRSRAYWELKAEQMMNRIFDPAEPIDLAVEPAPEPQPPDGPTPAAPPAPLNTAPSPTAGSDGSIGSAPGGISAGSAAGAAPAPSSRWFRPGSRLPLRSGSGADASSLRGRPDDRRLLVGALCGVCLASVAGSLLYFGHWTRLQQSIAQERNLLLLERLRSLGPVNPSPLPAPEPAAPLLPTPAAQGTAGADGLPPPPPQEAWIEQLSSLPATPPTPSRVLTVPVSPSLSATASPSARGSGNAPARGSASSSARPSATMPARAAAPLPQLVGVVAGAGRAPSAIFLVGGSSMSVASGELIGSTGWRLRSAEGETALLERGGELRQVSIASGNGF